MWTVVMFDLPTRSTDDKKRHTAFRSFMLKNGFIMMQYSVYLRHHPSTENAEVHARRIKNALPAKGEVRILRITDFQFSQMEVFHGKRRGQVETAPEQFQFF